MIPKNFWKVCALSVAIAAVAVGCGKKKAEGPGAEKAEEAGVGAGTGSGFAIFPATANPVIVGMNFENMRGSTLWKELWPMAEQTAAEDLKKFEAACGMGINNVKNVVFGGDAKKMGDGGKGMVMSVTGDLPQAKVIECIKKVAAEEKEEVEVVEDGQYVNFKNPKGDESIWVHFSDGGVVIAPEADKAYLQARVEGKDPITSNKEFMAMIDKVDTGGTMWFAANGGMEGADQPTGGHGSVRLDSGLKADIVATFKTAEEAGKMATQANTQMEGAKAMPQVAKFVDKVKVTSEAADLKVNIDLSDAEVKEIIAMAKAQLPMLMGGGF